MEIGFTILHRRSFLMDPGEVPASGYTGVRPGEMERSIRAREEQIRRKIYDLVHEANSPILFYKPYEIDLSNGYDFKIEKRIPFRYVNDQVILVPEHRERAVSPIVHLTVRERMRALFKGEFHTRTP